MPYNYARDRFLENRRKSDKVRKKSILEYFKIAQKLLQEAHFLPNIAVIRNYKKSLKNGL